MRIQSIMIREIKMNLVHPFETSFARVDSRNVLILKFQVDGEVGWSECVADASPSYSYETNRTVWHVLEDFVVPAILARDYSHPDEVWPSLEHIRGHNMAKAAVEMGIWDAYAHLQGKSLHSLLGGTRQEIASGVSIGIQENTDALAEKIRQALAAGYRRIKLKIKPGCDRKLVEGVRAHFPETPLMVDANSAYTLDDLPLFKELDRYDLMMIEQPLGYDDMWDHRLLQGELKTPICLDESIRSPADGRKAIEMGATRIINVKAGRVGGLSRARSLHTEAARLNVPVWCGGMLETGIGRAHNVHLSTLPNFTLPGDVADSKRYFEEEIIEPRVEVRPDGTIAVPDGPGIGYSVREDRVDAHTIRGVTLSQ